MSRLFTPITLELSPTPDFKKKKTKKDRVKIRGFWSHVSGLERSLINIFLLAILLQIFSLASPFYNQLIIDEVITKGDIVFLHVLLIGFSLLIFTEIFISVVSSMYGMYLINLLGFQMRSNLFDHLLKLPIQFFEKRHIGDVITLVMLLPW